MARTSKSRTNRAAARRTSTAASLPRIVGGWEIVEPVSGGALCEVFRARPSAGPAGTAAYALKLLRAALHDDPRALEAIRREALVGRLVSHRHLVTVLSAHVLSPPFFVVMPWLAGSSLDRLLVRGRVPPLPAALWLVRQTAEALDALHKAGWMHADVKPGNILVSPQGHATLLDLGFARRPDDGGWPLDRPVAGTTHYIAPEMITSALRPDIRSDIYSLGVTLFELLSGGRPFEGSDLAELARQQRQQEPPDLRRLAPHLPRSVAGLVHEMLSKEPLRRPQTPRELIDRLTALEIECFAHRP